MSILKRFFGKKDDGQPLSITPTDGEQTKSNPVDEESPIKDEQERNADGGQKLAQAGEKASPDNTGELQGITVHHLIVLDESGSMSGVRMQTVSGCNETIQTVRQMQKDNAGQKHFVSIYLFDSGNSRYIMKGQPVDKVKEITVNDYRPNSCTPLFDALGDTLTELRGLVGKGAMGYVTIITDGYENDSHRFTLDMVKALISQLKEMGVIFSFIGANIDAAAYAKSMNIDNSMQFRQDEAGTRAMWERERRSKMRSAAKMEYMRRFRHDIDEKEFYARENTGSYYDEQNDAGRITPERITTLRPNEVFVFGSNILGKHDGGAAGYAVRHFGAQYGQAEGLQGSSYAIPTVGVSEEQINDAVRRFCAYAAQHPELTFLVTPVGCGVAGHKPSVIAPMFMDATMLANVKLPGMFWDFL